LIEHLTQNQLENYSRQKLPAAELLSVSDHLSTCAACRRLLETTLDTDAAFFAVQSEVFGQAEEVGVTSGTGAHPAFEATAGYVDGTLPKEEMQVFTDHLSRCEQCALAVDDLRAFRKRIAPTLRHKYRPAIHVPAENWWHRLFALLPSPFRTSPALAFASAVIVLLLTVTGFVIWQQLQRGGTKQETAASAPEASVPAGVIAELRDGPDRLVLDQQGRLTGADDLPPGYRRSVQEALDGQRLEKSALLEGLSRPASSLMGGDDQGKQFSVIGPVGKVLLTDRPMFRWSRLDGATGYVVEIYDEKFKSVATSPTLTADSWTVPKPLRRDRVYSWQVKAIKDGQQFISPRPPAPQATFRVLDQAKTTELVEAQRVYASSHLTMALLYAQAGMLDEAEEELRALQKANPDSELVVRLLENVQAMRP
jgi:anti-sigma factor RsiW